MRWGRMREIIESAIETRKMNELIVQIIVDFFSHSIWGVEHITSDAFQVTCENIFLFTLFFHH